MLQNKNLLFEEEEEYCETPKHFFSFEENQGFLSCECVEVGAIPKLSVIGCFSILVPCFRASLGSYDVTETRT